jgi:uroporphyrin-3 C-methyltransferase
MSEPTEKSEKSSPPKPAPKHTPKPAPRPQSSGSSGAFLAMVIALAAGGGSYYVWQQHLIAEQDRQVLKQSIERLLEVVKEKDQAQLARIAQLAEHRHDGVEQRLNTLEQTLPELSRQLSLQQRDWTVAEVDYLLRLAGQQLQLNHDIPTAIAALGQARGQLVNYTNGNFATLIVSIDENIAELQQLEQDNVSRISQQLSALLTSLEELPFAQHASGNTIASPPPTPVAKDAALTDHLKYWGQLMWHDIMSLVTIRHSDEINRPLMNPEQRYFLQAQLRLKLETARLAAMGHNQELYHASLTEAAGWLSRYYDSNDGQVIEAFATLTRLASINVDPELPALQELRQQLHTARHATGVATTMVPEPADNASPLADSPPSPVVEEPVSGSPL